MMEKLQIFRIHLKTEAKDDTGKSLRGKFIQCCLHSKQQHVAIGWSRAYDDYEGKIQTYDDYYKAVCKWNKAKRVNQSWNRFKENKKDDLFWTRDLDGMYWICRSKGKAEAYYNKMLDIGAVIPVEAYKVGLEVPGQICGSFNQPRRPAVQRLSGDLVREYSKYIFNRFSGSAYYKILPVQEDLLKSLPAKDLEELVIDYLQIKKNYYVLSNSIANHSTTIKIECEFRSRDVNQPNKKAVVQVKSLDFKGTLDAKDFKSFVEKGYKVYLFGPKEHVFNVEQVGNCERITKEDLKAFYDEYKDVLPDSITKWENIIKEKK